MNSDHRYSPASGDSLTAAAHQTESTAPGFVLPDNRAQSVMQLKSVMKYSGQSYRYGKSNQLVGKTMEAWLDPARPMVGQESNLNTSQDAMMAAIRAKYNITGNNVVKGHLLNANLGGLALSYNLYPITKGANGAHLNHVENVAKNELWTHNRGIYYRVDVQGKPDIDTKTAAFDCKISEWTPSDTSKIGKQILGVSIKSNLKDVSSRKATNTLDPTKKAGSFGDPAEPVGFTEPATTVGELSKAKKAERQNDKNKTLESSAEWSMV